MSAFAYGKELAEADSQSGASLKSGGDEAKARFLANDLLRNHLSPLPGKAKEICLDPVFKPGLAGFS